MALAETVTFTASADAALSLLQTGVNACLLGGLKQSVF
ncbi:hypothetical protein EBBID32_570 [Sphingobium indicum BiD32]|uniref:Uncharacterized protein n=1 Tax=Sphingobium indicum BiD32 TaxID=1301087 RepID=N1MG52_9SPHN|nr:hypothetical protein EBBID32_570 [Sphingobium indicum BiD32]